MSILIRGMEMPTNCYDCPFIRQSFGFDFYCAKGNGIEDDIKNVYSKRMDDCPLVEVPPHGRLIDADAFATNLKDISVRQGYKNTLIDEHLTVDDVFDSIIDELTGKAIYGFEYNPTIIEAEGRDT